jgi:hypothetical protein
LAEIEFSVLLVMFATSLPRRVKVGVAAWETESNIKATKVNWRFTTKDVAGELGSYPSIED